MSQQFLHVWSTNPCKIWVNNFFMFDPIIPVKYESTISEVDITIIILYFQEKLHLQHRSNTSLLKTTAESGYCFRILSSFYTKIHISRVCTIYTLRVHNSTSPSRWIQRQTEHHLQYVDLYVWIQRYGASSTLYSM